MSEKFVIRRIRLDDLRYGSSTYHYPWLLELPGHDGKSLAFRTWSFAVQRFDLLSRQMKHGDVRIPWTDGQSVVLRQWRV